MGYMVWLMTLPMVSAAERFIDTVRRVGLEPFKAAANAARRPAETETA